MSVSPGVYNEMIDNHSKTITIESTGGRGDRHRRSRRGLAADGHLGETPVLRGFTVEGGVFTSDGPALIESNRVLDDESCSGGIVAYFSSATIQNNVVTGRPNCSLFRPAIDIGGAGTVTVTRNLITANAGGGISMNAAGSPTISRNTITANGGGGIGGVNRSDALIVNNVVAQNGYNGIDWRVPFGTRGPIIVNNTISANSLSAIFVDGFTRSMHVFNNILVGTGNQTVVNCPGSFFEKDPPILEFNDVISAGTGSRYGGVCSDTGETETSPLTHCSSVIPTSGSRWVRLPSTQERLSALHRKTSRAIRDRGTVTRTASRPGTWAPTSTSRRTQNRPNSACQ